MKKLLTLLFLTVCSLSYSQTLSIDVIETIDLVDTIYIKKVDAKQIITINQDGKMDTLTNMEDVYEIELKEIPERILGQYLDQISKNYTIIYYSIDPTIVIGVIPKQIF